MESCFYTSCNPIIVGCKLYQNNSATAFVADGYYSDGTNCYHVVSGSVTEINPCTSGTLIAPLASGGAQISNSNATYATGRNATTGSFINAGFSLPLFGVSKFNVTPYQFERGFFKFNTSAITSTVATAKMFIYITENVNSGSIVIMKYTGTNPMNALTTADYDSFSFAGNYSNAVTLPVVNNWVEIPLNAQALLDMNTNTSLDIVIISGGDFTGTPPATQTSGSDGGSYSYGTQYIEYTLV